MPLPAKRVLIFILAGVGLLAVFPVQRFVSEAHDYGEAEPLQPMVWVLADEMKRFASETGRQPNSLAEVAEFAPERDFSALRRYRHDFTTSGPVRFSMQVNQRFGFTIDGEYRPDWIFPGRLRGRPAASE